MANNTKQNRMSKPDNNERINQVLQQFQGLSEKDRLYFLQRAGVFFLSWQGRLISPTPELRGLINQVSRLANITNLLFDRVTRRQADVSALSVVSEEEIQRKVTTPTVQAIGEKVREILDVLDEQRSGTQQTECRTQAESGSEEPGSEAQGTTGDDEDLDEPIAG